MHIFPESIRKYYAPIILTLIVIGGVLAAVVLAVELKQSQDRQKESTAILEELDVNNPDSSLSKYLEARRKDDAEQTLLMCKIFISSDFSLAPQDLAQVERICKERIRILNESTREQSPNPGTNTTNQNPPRQTQSPSSGSGNPGGNNNPSPSPAPPPEEPEEPDQGLIPDGFPLLGPLL